VEFELGANLSPIAKESLKKACEFIEVLLTMPSLENWLAVSLKNK
jgi:hypothetical protein